MTYLQCLNLVQALSILNELCEGVVAAATWHALHLLANLQQQSAEEPLVWCMTHA